MDNQKHKSFPDKEQLKATYEKRVKSWSELFAKVFKIQKIHVEFLESGFQEKRLHILPLTRKMVQNICY